MKRTICLLLAVIFLLSVLSACSFKKDGGNAKPNIGLEDSIFDAAPEGGNSTQPQDPTKATAEQQGSTQPTQGQQSTGSTQPTTGQDTNITSPTTDSNTESTEPSEPEMTYEEWRNLTPAKQKEYQESFGTDEAGYIAFFNWYNKAYEAYRAANPPIEIGKDGKVTLD